MFSGFRPKLFKEPKIVFSNHPTMLQRVTLSRDFRKKVRSCISLIEATALHWDLTVVTHNTSDFVQARTLNPVAIGMTK